MRTGVLHSAIRLIVAAVLLPGIPRAAATGGPFGPSGGVTVHDDRLQLTVFASDPDIVTPIGIATDLRDRVFVLESHTHLQGSDYKGPRGDLVKIFTDDDRDGEPDLITTFATGIDDGMNLAFSPDGELYVAAAQAVWVLHDRDGDGVSDGRTRVLHMTKPERVYDHAALMGIAFSPDGWMYVSRGNTGGSAWRIEGTDGSSVSGYGDGGNIIRSRPDGSRVEEVATGFWNPFDLRFDAAGRLLATDNDPDSRGPNRLLHILPGGDYGYKSLYGGSGIHPYLAWNGELPGTLPYAAALGEAPSGMLIASTAALPPDYRQDVLVTIWEERTIVRVPLVPKGASIAGEARPLVQGDEQFRPVSFAADSRGTVYITDWVLRSYPNHGRGRIWRLTVKPGVEQLPGARVDRTGSGDGEDVLRALLALKDPARFDRLVEALTSDDPFVRSAAITALSRRVFHRQAAAATSHTDARVRVGLLLALQRGKYADGETLVRRLLEDPDLQVRKMAFIWAGSAGMLALRPVLDRAVMTEPPSPELFEVYLATLQQLTPEFLNAYSSEAEPYARQLKRLLRPRFVESFVADAANPPMLRAIAISHLESLASQVGLLSELATRADALEVRREAVRSLGMVSERAAGDALLQVVRNVANPPALRADALVGLARQPQDASADALRLLEDPSPAVRLEAARYLRSSRLRGEVRAAVEGAAAALHGADASALKAQLAFATGKPSAGPRPTSPGEWEAAVASGPGDAETGRRVFFSTGSACSQCHAIDRRGGDLGPDLTNAGRSKSGRQLLDALLRPSAEISPEYQGWFVKTRDGQVHTGRQIDVGDNGKAELYVLSGEFIALEGITEYGPMPQSLMPAGLETNLTVQDVRDLIAFLRKPAAAR